MVDRIDDRWDRCLTKIENARKENYAAITHRVSKLEEHCTVQAEAR
jgi:hypothetical protein